jgi:hypothetical protein
MTSLLAYGDTVAARGDVGAYVLERPVLLAGYVELGGLPEDLALLRDKALEAEACNQRQGVAGHVAVGATAEALGAYRAVQQEYVKVMAVVEAVAGDLREAGAPVTLVRQVEGILANEAQTSFSPPPVPGAKRRATRKQSREAVRAEVARDAQALLDLTDVHGLLARRRVDLPRLERLRAGAAALSGKLAFPAQKRGARKAVTQEERQAVAAQAHKWVTCHRLLRTLAGQDGGLAELVKRAARKR